jgi:hypothetical protein
MSFEFPVDRFEPDGQNADDNDQGDYSCLTARSAFDEESKIVGLSGKSYKQAAGGRSR